MCFLYPQLVPSPMYKALSNSLHGYGQPLNICLIWINMFY